MRPASRPFESVSVGGRHARSARSNESRAYRRGPRPPGSFRGIFTAPSIFSLPLRSVPREGPRRPSSHRSGKAKRKKQLQTVDRSAPASMKNAANCVNQCELQDTLIIDVSNAHGGSGSLPEPRPVEGRFLPLRDFATAHPVASRTVPRGTVRSAPRGRLRVRGTRSARVLSLPALRGARVGLLAVGLVTVRLSGPFAALGPRRGARLPFRGLSPLLLSTSTRTR